MKILLLFNDNDFRSTLVSFGLMLVDAVRSAGDDSFLTKTRILGMWNEMSLGLYMLYQNRWRYRCLDADLEYTRRYLQIGKSKLLVGDDVDAYVYANQRRWNGEWLFVDTSTGTVTMV